jgi:hypothetical protein
MAIDDIPRDGAFVAQPMANPINRGDAHRPYEC